VERIVAALKGNGVPCEYLVFSDEGSGISRPQNRMKFWAAAETFLAEYLGGRRERRGAR
jgi:dipeptidyl aminopeptidase/acylaminoacyl peptidase